MGASKNGGMMPLPRICGFAEEFFFSHKLTPDDEHKMASMLGHPRFQKGNRAARCYANLVVLFRLLLFYDRLKNDGRFWGWVATDWGIINADGNRAMVGDIAHFYSDARYSALGGATEQRLSLLVRLVDEWLMIRPRPEFAYSEVVHETTIQATRSAWLSIRDHHVDMLMDSRLPASLVDVEPPAKIVTSLWEMDPEVAALMKEIKTSRKQKSFFNKTATRKPPNVHGQPTGSDVQRKRKASLSEGEIDESEPTLAFNDSGFDERSFTPFPEIDGRELTLPVPADHAPKRTQFVGGGHISETYAAKSADGFDLIDFTSAAGRAPLASYESFQQPVSKPLPAREPTQQPAANPSPVLVQSTLSHFAKSQPSKPALDKREELSAALRAVASQTQRRQTELHARVETETAGYVPLTNRSDGSDGLALEVAGGGLAASERDMYETRLREMEARLAALEGAHRQESSWARAMGRFLYDANGKSIKTMQDVFVAIETLQKTASALLESGEKRDE